MSEKTDKNVRTMRDANGNDVPVKYVSKYDRLRDKITRRIHTRFVKAREGLEALMKECIADLDELAACKETLGKKGNFQARSFDGSILVSIRQQYNILLDERVAKARELMLTYINGVLARVGGNDARSLGLIVEEAFRANSQGILSTGKILALMRMEIDNAAWREAKMILQDAIKPQKGKRYLKCEVCKDLQHGFAPILLDLADCWPEAPEGGAQ